MFPVGLQQAPASSGAVPSTALPGRGPEADHRTSLLRELRRSSRYVLGVLCLMLVSVLAVSGYVLGSTQEQLRDYTTVTRELRLNHEAMLDQETGLRAWLATGDSQFLTAYTAGTAAAARAQQALRAHLDVDTTLAGQLMDVALAQQAWEKDWADRAVPMAGTAAGDADLTAFLLEGKEHFDAYRVTYAAAVETAAGGRDRSMVNERRAVEALAASQVALTLLALGILLHRSRRLERLVARPVQLVEETIERIHRGQRLDFLPDLRVRELDDVTKALVELSHDLHRERAVASQEKEHAQRSADRLANVLAFGQAMAACTSETALLALLVRASAQLTGGTTSLWFFDDHDGTYACQHRSDPLRPLPDDAGALVRAVVGDARGHESEEATAIPLVGSGRVLAVLHIQRGGRGSSGGADPDPGADPGADPDVDLDVALQAFTVNAAAHLEAVRLHERTRTQASTDELTGLGNRHTMREELDREWARAARHDRPLALGMIDLDHFKQINDTAGHPVGDAWLRAVAEVVTGQLRTHDRAYRYGGEEIAVLLPETCEADAALLFERIRAAIEAEQGPAAAPHVTASIGVADRVGAGDGVDSLIAVADRALYQAKRAGRNLVVRSSALRTTTAERPLPG